MSNIPDFDSFTGFENNEFENSDMYMCIENISKENRKAFRAIINNSSEEAINIYTEQKEGEATRRCTLLSSNNLPVPRKIQGRMPTPIEKN